MILAYRIISNFLYPFLIAFTYLRKFFNKEHQERYKEKIFISNFNIEKKENEKLIWFHAASIGELKSIFPVIERINKEKNIYNFLITTNTLSSGNLANSILKDVQNIKHRYMPLDVNFLIKNFLESWKPEKIFLIDSEIWPNLIINAKQKKIPIALLNARLTKKSFNRWFKFPKTAKKIFEIFDLCICSNNETKNFLEKLNARNIKYEGNIKFLSTIDEKKFNNKNDQILSNSRFWIAASIHEGEDLFCIKTHLQLKKNYKDVKTILAPRHLDRVKKIKSLSDSLGIKTQILNNEDEILNDVEIIILNSYGMLQNYYKYAKSVFIGKSIIKNLAKDSGQNPIDAAKLNCKIYHGPYVSNFEEIYKVLSSNKISKEINDFTELSNYLNNDLNNFQKEINNKYDSIKVLEKNILKNTTCLINNFLNDKIK